MAVKLELYRVFKEVAETGNISLAAKNLYISQSAVSQSIKQLETALQARLFARSPRGVSLTWEGQMLYQYVRNALGLLASEGLADTYKAWEDNNQQLIENRKASYEFQMAMAELAETIQPFLTDIVEIGTQVLDFFNSLPPSVQTAIGVFLLLVAAISPIAGIISSVAITAGMAGIAMSTWLPIIIADRA